MGVALIFPGPLPAGHTRTGAVAHGGTGRATGRHFLPRRRRGAEAARCSGEGNWRGWRRRRSGIGNGVLLPAGVGLITEY